MADEFGEIIRDKDPHPDRRRTWVFRLLVAWTVLALLLFVYWLTSRGLYPYTGLNFLSPTRPTEKAVVLAEILFTPSSARASTATQQSTILHTPSSTIENPPTTTFTATPAPSLTPLANLPLVTQEIPDGLWVVSSYSGLHAHLYLYHPEHLPFTRITTGAWDDIQPAIHPDQSQIIFASNRDGQWDLYLLALSTGEVTRLTNTPDYEGSPSFSPDGLFYCYEAYVENNLDIYIQATDNSIQPIRLTDDPDSDYLPAWSPAGRSIAFVSNRTGEPEIWLANLAVTDNRFTNLSNNASSTDHHPAWNSEGNKLAWASNQGGLRQIVIYSPESGARVQAGTGDLVAWSPQYDLMAVGMEYPNGYYLSGYQATSQISVAYPILPALGRLEGLAWGNLVIPDPLPEVLLNAAREEPPRLWSAELANQTPLPGGRQNLIPLQEMDRDDLLLHDMADEAFYALREEVGRSSGWNFLSTLQSAFIPLNSPLLPGMDQDWLYTGRGISLNTAPMNAGWLKIVKEEYNHETYWRIFLRVRFQNGQQGRPLYFPTWDLNARFNGDPTIFERGGRLDNDAPAGFWIDFTQIALAYGWERLPALVTWRSYYQGARFNEYALRLGLDWETAILEVYPEEVLVTLTPVLPITPSATPTITPVPTKTPTPSRTPTSTPTSSSPTPTATPRTSPTTSNP